MSHADRPDRPYPGGLMRLRQRFSSARRKLLGLEGLDRHLAAIEAHLSALDACFTPPESALTSTRDVDPTDARLAALEQRSQTQHLEIENVSAIVRGLADPWRHALPYGVQMAAAHASVGPTMDWIARTTVEETTTVSVVLPTRNRRRLVQRAIESVLAQSYPRWQLLVVDDDSDDDTASLLATFGAEQRMETLHTNHVGSAAARNGGLEAADGEVVAYLDDDNVMHPDWLKAIVWAFTEWPTVDVLYGAELIDDRSRLEGRGEGGSPFLSLLPFDRSLFLEDVTIADTSALAHRTGIANARFDEALVPLEDRDMVINLCRTRDPLMLPVVACYYTTEAGGRQSAASWTHKARAIMERERARSRIEQAPTLDEGIVVRHGGAPEGA